jgi:hypothetical protein
VLEDLNRGRLPDYPLQRLERDSVTETTEEASPAPFDVFLSYNSEDLDMVQEVAEALKSRGVRIWFDVGEVQGGKRFSEELEEIIRNVSAAAVFIGASGIGPWQSEEIQACLRQSVYRGQTVIPVLLPNATEEPKLPVFLEHRSRVDLRTQNGLDRLLWAIKGTRPQPLAASA